MFEEFPFKNATIGFLITFYVIELALLLRQWRHQAKPKASPALAPLITPEEYANARKYNLDKLEHRFIKDLFNIIISSCLLWFDGLVVFYDIGERVLSEVEFSFPMYAEIAKCCVFVLVMYAFNYIVELPMRLYVTFIVEQKHGFNRQSIGLFFFDDVKMLLLLIVLGLPLISGLIAVIILTGPMFYLYAYFFMLIVTIFMMTVFPIWIQPLFNKIEPLPQGPLRTKIEALASKCQFPLKKLFVIDGSKRSSHSNAYLYGLFKNKRIVLFDTLIQEVEEDQVVAILAHEIGHWKLGHNISTFALGQVQIFANFFIAKEFIFNEAVFASFGFHDRFPVLIGLYLYTLINTPVDQVIGFFVNNLIRMFEFQADGYAVTLGYGELLKMGLVKLTKKNMSNYDPDWLYALFNISHPSMVERVKAIEKATKKEK